MDKQNRLIRELLYEFQLGHNAAEVSRNICEVKANTELEGIGLMPSPTFSPDLAPSDYYFFFRSMAHFLIGGYINNQDKMETGVRTICLKYIFLVLCRYPRCSVASSEDNSKRWLVF
ncbi:hypothetical protein NPIL_380961 [Nephila pilipes]|uniref:Uncharacterized protein n=1 Tax=Nephila pilipes TaxID=299642 RepID=A0A8X6KDR5_NEPPI|nr:hypothetical protein NPIL_380961 [Nephila pilipes]